MVLDSRRVTVINRGRDLGTGDEGKVTLFSVTAVICHDVGSGDHMKKMITIIEYVYLL